MCSEGADPEAVKMGGKEEFSFEEWSLEEICAEICKEVDSVDNDSKDELEEEVKGSSVSVTSWSK